MGVFDDKRYEELDWISQATEPIESHLNDYLAKMPDEFEITADNYMSIVGDSSSLDLSKDRVARHLINLAAAEHNLPKLSWEEQDVIKGSFEFELTGEPVLNFEINAITGGTIRFVKSMPTLDERVLETLLGRNGLQAIRDLHIIDVRRLNEILELLGNAETGLKKRSLRKKKYALYNRVVNLMKHNEWKIKSTDLADKVGLWIADYIRDGNLSALSNFCRLKVMTHKGLPIYSMEEVQ